MRKPPFHPRRSFCRLGVSLLALALPLVPASGQERPFSAWTSTREPVAAGEPATVGNPSPALSQLGPLAQSSEATLNDIFKTVAARRQELELNLWFPGVPILGDAEIAQGAAIAQGIALRAGNTPVHVSCEPGIVPGRFNVVVGGIEELRGYLTAEDVKENSNGFLILRRLQNRPDTPILLIAGRNAFGLESAILTLGIAREPLPGAATAAIQSVLLPKAPPFLRREPLRSDSSYTFQQLLEGGASLQILPNRNLSVEFMLPGDYSAAPKSSLALELHFTVQGQLLRGGDQVAVRINGEGELERSGRLSSEPGPSGGTRAVVELPAGRFAPGRNFLEVDFSGGAFRTPADLQILSDSSLTIPAFGETPVLPNLAITTRTAFPLVGQPDGSEIAVVLADNRRETVESAWTLLAKLAQISNTLLYAAEYHTTGGLHATEKHVIAVGSADTLPEGIHEAVPKDLFSDAPALPAAEEAVTDGVNLKDALDRLRHGVHDSLLATPGTPPRGAGTRPEREGNPQERGFLACIPPRSERHGWLLLLTSPTPALLQRRTNELVSPGFWERISAASVYWNESPESLHPYVDPNYAPVSGHLRRAGEFEVEMPLGEQFQVRSWAIAVGLTLLLLILTLFNTLARLQRNGGLRR